MTVSELINNPQKFGLFTSHFYEDAFDDWFNIYQSGLEYLNKGVWIAEENGGNWKIIDVFINREENCLAWIEWFMDDSSRIEKHEYYLCAFTASFQRLRKEIASYNPYFGISIESIKYNNGVVKIKYQDKHEKREMELHENNHQFKG